MWRTPQNLTSIMKIFFICFLLCSSTCSAQKLYSDSQLYARDFVVKIIRDSIYIFSKDTLLFSKIQEFEKYINLNKEKITNLKSYLAIELSLSANKETVKAIRELMDKRHWSYTIAVETGPHPKRNSRNQP